MHRAHPHDAENVAPPGTALPRHRARKPLGLRPPSTNIPAKPAPSNPAAPSKPPARKRRALGDITNNNANNNPTTAPPKNPTKQTSTTPRPKHPATTRPAPRNPNGDIADPEPIPESAPRAPYTPPVVEFSPAELATLAAEDENEFDPFGPPYVDDTFAHFASQPVRVPVPGGDVLEEERFEGRLDQFCSVERGDGGFRSGEALVEDELALLELA